MRLPRLSLLAMIATAVLLAACSSSDHSNRPAPSSTTPSTAASSTSSTTAGTSTTGEPTTVATTSSTTTTSAGTPAGPRILSLTGPRTPVECNAPTSVQLHWETRGAKTVILRIDSGPDFATYHDGKNDPLVPLACDGNPHTYRLTAHAADGQTATKSLKITERASL